MRQPQFNPSCLVLLVMETLGRRGIQTTVDSVNVGPSVNAAADLLRALGVQPTTAPDISKRD